MQFTVKIGQDLFGDPPSWGVAYQLDVAAETIAEAMKIASKVAKEREGFDPTILWVRDGDRKVVYYAGKSFDSYEYQLVRSTMRKAFERVLPEWPKRIDVSVKEWSPDGQGCYIPALSQASEAMELRFEEQAEADLLGVEVEYAGLVIWYIFGALHRRAMKTEHWLETQSVTFNEIEEKVIDDFLGWKGDKVISETRDNLCS